MNSPTVRRKQVHQFKEPARVDSYRSQSKTRGTPRCPVCSAVSVRGRWLSRTQATKNPAILALTSKLTCPACNQLEQQVALGVIELRGKRWKEKQDLIISTVLRTEKIARNRNDQERILWTKELKSIKKIYVTLPTLARSIGRELEKSFQGVTEYEHSTEEAYLRVRWWSDLPHRAHQLGAPLQIKRKSRAPSMSDSRSKAFRGRGRMRSPTG